MQGKPSKACFRTTRGSDATDDVHSCYFSEGVFRDALNELEKHIGSDYLEEAEENIAAELEEHPPIEQYIRPILLLMEKYPLADWGMPGELVYLL